MNDQQRSPTHVLTVKIPLALDEPSPDYDAVEDAIKLCLAVSRAAYSGHMCNTVVVDIHGVRDDHSS